MAERVVLVCDVCGEVATKSVNFRVDQRSLTKDLCDVHVQELMVGARSPKPGRRRKTVAARPEGASGGSTAKTRARKRAATRRKTSRPAKASKT